MHLPDETELFIRVEGIRRLLEEVVENRVVYPREVLCPPRRKELEGVLNRRPACGRITTGDSVRELPLEDIVAEYCGLQMDRFHAHADGLEVLDRYHIIVR